MSRNRGGNGRISDDGKPDSKENSRQAVTRHERYSAASPRRKACYILANEGPSLG